VDLADDPDRDALLSSCKSGPLPGQAGSDYEDIMGWHGRGLYTGAGRRRSCNRSHGGGAEGVPAEQQRGGSGGTPPDSRIEAFREALADDFNTPRALAEVSELVAEANREEIPGAPEAVREMLELVGLGTLTQPDEGVEADQRAVELMAEREEARAAKDFERADAIRDELAALGWEVRDSADGPTLVPRP
jgi:cysteinyl-tRNA synthetase